MQSFWISLVWPILNYYSPIWSSRPTCYGNIVHLEDVLRTFIYLQVMLKVLKILATPRGPKPSTSKVYRADTYSLKYYIMFKIKEGPVSKLSLNPSNPSLVLVTLDFKRASVINNRCELNKPILYHNPAEIQCGCSHALTACNLWNCLPQWPRAILKCSFDKFKNLLD